MKRSRPKQHKRRLPSGRVIIVNKGRKKVVNRKRSYHVSGNKKLRKALRKSIEEDTFIKEQLSKVTKPKMGKVRKVRIKITNDKKPLFELYGENSPSGTYRLKNKSHHIELFPRVLTGDNASLKDSMFQSLRTLAHELDHAERHKNSDKIKLDTETFATEDAYEDRPGEIFAFKKSDEWEKSKEPNWLQLPFSSLTDSEEEIASTTIAPKFFNKIQSLPADKELLEEYWEDYLIKREPQLELTMDDQDDVINKALAMKKNRLGGK